MFAILVAVERRVQRSAVAASWLHGGEGEGGADNVGRRGDAHHPTHAGPQGQAPPGLLLCSFYTNPLSDNENYSSFLRPMEQGYVKKTTLFSVIGYGSTTP